LLGGAWASATAVADELGPFDSPYPSAAAAAAEHAGWLRDVAAWPAVAAYAARLPSTQSVDTAENSPELSVDVLASGREFLPTGGFSGQVPSTPLHTFVDDVRGGRVRHVLVLASPRTRNPDMRWVLAHCIVQAGAAATVHEPNGVFRRYVCAPSQAQK
jgi:hypothetical protein